MSVGGPSKYCPRCNTVLPVQATFCGTCGLQFPAPTTPSAPPASNYGPTQYAGPGAPGSWPQGQAGYPPQGQPGYGAYPPQGQPGYGAYVPQGQPGYAGYPAAPGAPAGPVFATSKKGGAGKVIILVLVLVVVLGGGAAAWFLYLNPALCSGPLFNREGQPSNVPLPHGCSYVDKDHQTITNPQIPVQQATIDQWAWTVNGSNIAAVKQFYNSNLSGQGWSTPKEQTASNGSVTLISCQGTSQALEVDIAHQLKLVNFANGNTIATATAPDGNSSALGVTLFTSGTPGVIQQICSGQIPSQ